MAFIVKEVVQANPLFKVETPTSRFELYTTEVVKDINDTEVTLPKIIGVFTLVGLQAQKERLLKEVDDVDEKIKAIEDATKG